MSPLSFVHSDGSTTTNTLNKKLVRSHVSKYFHPKKQEQKKRKQQPIHHCQPRLIAPYRPDPAETSVTEDQDTEFEWIDDAILDLSNHDSLVSRSRTPSFLEETCTYSSLTNNFNFPDSNEYMDSHSDDIYYNPAEYHGVDQMELEFISCPSDSGAEGGNNIVEGGFRRIMASNFWWLSHKSLISLTQSLRMCLVTPIPVSIDLGIPIEDHKWPRVCANFCRE